MTEQEKIFFEAIYNDRKDSVIAMSKRHLRGMWTSIVEKYTGQAHFIYELLQNADDAGATHARFVLNDNELIFAHNGTRHFSVTDPNDEELDTVNKTLGDVNAITSVANSNKTESTIGKFGVGFKAVFQYTRTPHIYDVNFSFKIEHYIMPKRLEGDHPERGSMETLFVFPFDNPAVEPERAEQEIADKLAALTLPTLFLKNLQRIEYDHGSGKGRYTKTIETKLNTGSVTIERIRMWQYHFGVDGKSAPPQSFWMFTKTERIDGYDTDLSIGFAVDDKNKLAPMTYNAFCFFPTKEKTGLNFIIHAPFLLTDSREGIRANSDFNRLLIKKLAELSATALIHLKGAGLIDDDILRIISCDPSTFTALDDRDQTSFLPFYDEIKKTFRTEEILPTAEPKKYVSSENAYWATTAKLSQLFDNAQLKMLTGNPKAMWAFTSVSERHVGGGAINRYVKDLVTKSFEDENLLPLITAEFIERQKISWLHDFYLYLTETAPRMKLTRTLPIFLNQDRKATAAFDANGRATLFMPLEGVDGYATVYRELLKDEEIKQCLEKFGIKAPSLKDEIYNKILPMYRSSNEIDPRPHIRTFLRYYFEASMFERERLVEDLRHYQFVLVKTLDGKVLRCSPDKAYFYSAWLAQYFQGVPKIYFVYPEDYELFIPKREHEALKVFLKAVGVAFDVPRLVERHIARAEAERLRLPRYDDLREMIWKETCIDGCQAALKFISESRDMKKSLALWNILLKVFEHHLTGRRTPEKELIGYAQLDDNTQHRKNRKGFPSTDIAALRQTPWLLDVQGHVHSPLSLDTSTLSKEYDRKSEDAERLIKFLGIKELIGRKEKQSPPSPPAPSTPSTTSPSQSTPPPSTPSFRAEPKTVENKSEDPAKEIENLTKKYEEELQKLNQKAELIARAESAQKYSYEWFTTLLELEKFNSDDASDSRKIEISFSRVERMPDTRRTLILKYPSRYIPRSIEELTDIPLKLSRRGEKIAEPIIDAISIKSFTLRVKIKDINKLAGVDLSSIDEAYIKADSPVFLLDALIKSFKALNFEPTFDMKSNLPSNIKFIFGPPGTGKTTYLAREILIPLMRGMNSARILVLTPTNKAADVLVSRIISLLDVVNDRSYVDWLLRFVFTNDETIEERGVLRDRTFNITRLARSITVTTVARFPYDYFISGDKRLPLQDIDWNYIVIDEASMIALADIILPLYKKTPTQFIIAGDPFQIEPITKVEQWKDENIYSAVGLSSFQNPMTEPHDYPVKLLTMQYRSVPTVGEIFSRFAYDGVLEHHRSTGSQRRLHLVLPFRTLNLIKFPVSKYESIYRPKRLQSGSPYQIYSALFTFELVKYLGRLIAERHSGEKFSIGIILPYRAEADLINKLTASMKLPSSIEIQVGTIHGFQGDECDIIFVVLNSPPSIQDNDNMFLNKLNIINVAISRARDYLFVLMPDDQTENIERLRSIKRLEQLIRLSGECYETTSTELEQIIFGSTTFIEDNAFSTAHQNVNIYGSIERRYEIRSEDAAVDIQLHEFTSAARG